MKVSGTNGELKVRLRQGIVRDFIEVGGLNPSLQRHRER